MNKLVKVDQAHPAYFDKDQIALIKRTICKGATDDELKMFMYQAERTGLDPFARQIYSIERREKRGDSWVTVRSIQTSIDGFRLIAERTGKYAGQVGPFWCGPDGGWQDAWLDGDPPTAAKVGVLRTDFKEPCWGVARFDAYAQRGKEGLTRMWKVMGDVMVAKCAEALALRKAFPQELSGLYTGDEMQQATPAEAAAPEPSAVEAPRQNPHVTRVEDVTDRRPRFDENGTRIDWIDTSMHRVKHLTGESQKTLYKTLRAAMLMCNTPAELVAWGEDHAEEVAQLGKGEEFFQLKEYQEYLDELREKAKEPA
jgi:phage recombination protein Bet